MRILCPLGALAVFGLGCGGTRSIASPQQFQFSDAAPWNRSVASVAVSPQSASMIETLRRAGGWGARNQFRIDFSLRALRADGSTPRRSFEPTDDFFAPDCDHLPVPVPGGGGLEGETGYECRSDGDCHLIVIEQTERRLYEMWRADIRNERFSGGCLAVWNLDETYDQTLRGDGCTSADASGLPIYPLLTNPDEVATGEIRHALRFVLPNDRIRSGGYVSPATHSTGATRGGEHAMPYGVRLRLRSDYPIERLADEGPRVWLGHCKPTACSWLTRARSP